jgi:pimeloyl-ACP methyl ester carboxylesterase
MNAQSWHFKAVPGYDYITEMARLGHASVFIDQLGYGTSDIPDGRDLCLGSLADIAVQIGDALRSGDYSGEAVHRFDRVALAGHSGGGATAHTAAFSFPDAFDALILAGYTDIAGPQTSLTGVRTQSTALGAVGRAAAVRCLTPEPKYPGGPGGYAAGFSRQELAIVYPNAEPAVLDAYAELGELDACGGLQSAGTAVVVGLALSSASITSPVLIVLGEHDVFSATDGEAMRAQLLSSDDVSLEVIAGAGHGPWLERTAAAARAVMHGWLAFRGF